MGSADLKAIELPQQLQFVAGYESGWVDFMAPPAALFILFLWAIVIRNDLLVWFVFIGYLLLVLWWLHSPVTRIFVSETELLARGNLGFSYSDTRRVNTEDLKSLSFFPGAQREPAGLYAHPGWTKTCLIPRLTPQEANSIVAAIHRKFPYIENGYEIEMTAVHAEANGDFNPHISTVEVNAIDEIRQWKATKARELEVDNLLQWAEPKPSDAEPKDLESK